MFDMFCIIVFILSKSPSAGWNIAGQSKSLNAVQGPRLADAIVDKPPVQIHPSTGETLIGAKVYPPPTL